MRMPLALAVGGVACVLAIVIAFEPVQGDGWSSYFAARTALTWESLVALARHNHDLNNPRWGQLVLAVSYHHGAIAIVLTPLAVVGTVLLAQTLAVGRRPRLRSSDDAWLFICLFAALAITTPKVGVVWFYRPSCANYIYPLVVQLAWLVPYRGLLAPHEARSSRSSRVHRVRATLRRFVAVLGIVVLGWLAGAGNEHTGPALALAAVACIVVAWRRDRRVPIWAFAGLAALVVGVVFLVTSPGQDVRYGGLASRQSLLAPLVERGALGTLAVVRMQLVWASAMTLVLLVAARVARRQTLSVHGSSTTVREPLVSARSVRLALGFVGIATIVVGTALFSPKLPARLLAASAAMIVIAMGIVMVELVRDVGAARVLRWSCTALASGFLVYALVLQIVTGVEWRRRIAILDAAPGGSVVEVPRYTFAKRRLVSFGDDFASERLRQDIAFTLGLAEIRWR
ncbi:MAG: DUF6056 family protein [Kofleriaceae bacterium]